MVVLLSQVVIHGLEQLDILPIHQERNILVLTLVFLKELRLAGAVNLLVMRPAKRQGLASKVVHLVAVEAAADVRALRMMEIGVPAADRALLVHEAGVDVLPDVFRLLRELLPLGDGGAEGRVSEEVAVVGGR